MLVREYAESQWRGVQYMLEQIGELYSQRVVVVNPLETRTETPC